MKDKNLLIIVVGPTASGKSEYAVSLAKRVGGEIISADSRQIYRGMDIGSGKVSGKWKQIFEREKNMRSQPRQQARAQTRQVFVYKGVPHYLIDVASPRAQYSVARFQREAEKVIADILARGKQPIICGGTAHWVDAVAFGQVMPAVKADAKLRAQLAKLSAAQMFAKLKRRDPARAKMIDQKNPRRLVRALEIVITTGKPVPKLKHQTKYELRWIGLNPPQNELEAKIRRRLKSRLRNGMIAEVKKLRAKGLSWKRLESFGLEYKYCALFLQGKLTRAEMKDQLYIAIRQYAKRQMTWWKRNSDILWKSDPKQLL